MRLARRAVRTLTVQVTAEQCYTSEGGVATNITEQIAARYSPEIEGGRIDVHDVLKPFYEKASKALGREFEYPHSDS